MDQQGTRRRLTAGGANGGTRSDADGRTEGASVVADAGCGTTAGTTNKTHHHHFHVGIWRGAVAGGLAVFRFLKAVTSTQINRVGDQLAVGANIKQGPTEDIVGESRTAPGDATGYGDSLTTTIDAAGVSILTRLIEEAGELQVAASVDHGPATDRGLNGLIGCGLGLGTGAGAGVAPSRTNTVGIDTIARMRSNFYILGIDAGPRTN